MSGQKIIHDDVFSDLVESPDLFVSRITFAVILFCKIGDWLVLATWYNTSYAALI